MCHVPMIQCSVNHACQKYRLSQTWSRLREDITANLQRRQRTERGVVNTRGSVRGDSSHQWSRIVYKAWCEAWCEARFSQWCCSSEWISSWFWQMESKSMQAGCEGYVSRSATDVSLRDETHIMHMYCNREAGAGAGWVVSLIDGLLFDALRSIFTALHSDGYTGLYCDLMFSEINVLLAVYLANNK